MARTDKQVSLRAGPIFAQRAFWRLTLAVGRCWRHNDAPPDDERAGRGGCGVAMDEIEEELEALEALYPEGLRVTRAGTASSGGSTQAQHTTVALDVTPRTLDDETRQYARVTFRIVLDNDYPAGAPSLALTDAKGLDDTRQATVMGRLRDAADECIGDPVLALLCETAFETLTELNHPDGDCAFCLTPVCPDPSVVQEGAETFMKLGKCFHCFHTSCFAEWWRWRIRAAEEEASSRGPAHPIGSEEAERRTVHTCPVCRSVIDDDDARRVTEATHSEATHSATTGDDDDDALTEDEMSALRVQRVRFEEAMERQRSKGGLVGEGDGEGIDIASAVLTSLVPTPTAGDGQGGRGGGGGRGGAGGRNAGDKRGGRSNMGGRGRGGAKSGSGGRSANTAEAGRGDRAGAAGGGGGGLDWLKRAAASSTPFAPPAPNPIDSIERGVREVSIEGGRGKAGGRVGKGRKGGRGRGAGPDAS